MKAFILGAGLGTRLRPLTEKLPKPLVPVFNRPMVELALDACIEAGVSAFAINTHHCPEAWLTHFPEQAYRGCPIDFFHEEVLLETGGGLKNIEDWIGADSLLVHNGDILSSLKLSQLVQKHQQLGACATLALRSSGPATVLEFDPESSKVRDLRNALGHGPGTHQFTGIYCLEPEFLQEIPAGQVVSAREAMVTCAARGDLAGCVLDEGDWLDLGTLDTYFQAHLDSPSQERIAPSAEIHPEAQLSPSTWVGAHAQIHAGAILHDCVVWPGATLPAGYHAEREVIRS